MPIFIATLLGGLINVAGSIAGRVLLSLGITAVTYTGFTATLDYFKTSMLVDFQLLPPEIIGMLSLMRVGSAISIILSAIIVRWTLNGLTGGNLKRLVGA